MRLKRYFLNESRDELVEMIYKDCKPFIKANKHSGLFTRAAQFSNNKNYIKKTQRTDRRPSDTPKHLHGLIDSWFKKKFGWNARSEGLFTWSKNELSNALTVWPIGPIKYIYSLHARDMYNKLHVRTGQIYKTALYYGNTDIELQDTVFNDIFLQEMAPFYTDKILPNSHKKEVEVMFGCKEYYLVHYDFYNFLLDNYVY